MDLTSADLTSRWHQLEELKRTADAIGALEVWVFGSMLDNAAPRDLDVAVIYSDRERLAALRDSRWWELTRPPVEIIGLTRDEDAELRFLEGVRAVPLRARGPAPV